MRMLAQNLFTALLRLGNGTIQFSLNGTRMFDE